MLFCDNIDIVYQEEEGEEEEEEEEEEGEGTRLVSVLCVVFRHRIAKICVGLYFFLFTVRWYAF